MTLSTITKAKCQCDAFYDFCSFWSVAANITNKLLFLYTYICGFVANFSTFYSLRIGRALCINTPNSTEISPTVFDISWFFNVQDGVQPSKLLKIAEFIGWLDPEYQDTSSAKLRQIGQSIAEIRRFFDFLRWQPSAFFRIVLGTFGPPMKSI